MLSGVKHDHPQLDSQPRKFRARNLHLLRSRMQAQKCPWETHEKVDNIKQTCASLIHLTFAYNKDSTGTTQTLKPG